MSDGNEWLQLNYIWMEALILDGFARWSFPQLQSLPDALLLNFHSSTALMIIWSTIAGVYFFSLMARLGRWGYNFVLETQSSASNFELHVRFILLDVLLIPAMKRLMEMVHCSVRFQWDFGDVAEESTLAEV
jgi:hypothetical protein